MKRALKIIAVVVGVFILIGACGIFYLTRGLSSGKKLEIGTVELSNLVDGTYKGKYKSGRWTNEVGVTVKDHKITQIDILKDVKFHKAESAKELLDRVIARQNTDVDTVSGATVTSKAYLKAIENALKKDGNP